MWRRLAPYVFGFGLGSKGPLSTEKRHLVARMTSSRRPPASALATISSLSPTE